MRSGRLAATLALAALAACGSGNTRTETGPGGHRDGALVATSRRTAVKAKELSAVVKKGLAWLAKHQTRAGGWGQGDEAATMGDELAQMRDLPNVADTSMALLAFLRAGNTARSGEYRDAVQRGLTYVISEIEASDDDSLKVTNVTGTRVQMKIGAYADTFAALMVLNEARGTMRDGVANARLDAALRKVVHKIEKNQRSNGSWDDNGWAPVLSQAMAAKGLNRAAQNNIPVSRTVLERVEKQAQANFNATSGSFSAEGAAGVEVYGAAASSAAQRDSAATKTIRAEDMKAKAGGSSGKNHESLFQSPDKPTKADVAKAEKEAKDANFAADQIDGALVRRLDDRQFIAGFGNNGGEEYLSYLLISESLVQKGGQQWTKWDNSITQLVDGVQNGDGSWTGHHCITGRTFCTAAALLVLMGDRTPAGAATIAS